MLRTIDRKTIPRSGKQKRVAMALRRKMKAGISLHVEAGAAHDRLRVPAYAEPVQLSALAPCNSYGTPQFVARGYYEAQDFICRDCGAAQLWTAKQQKWWYETAKGYVYSKAVRCLPCRIEHRLAPHRKKMKV